MIGASPAGYIHIQHVCYITRDILLYTIRHSASNAETKNPLTAARVCFFYMAAKPTIPVE